MKRIVLLRFHKNPSLVQNRINLINYFNPEIEIYGLFGGNKKELPDFEKLTGFKHLFFLDIKDRDIKWRFSDYSILNWYTNYGKNIEFDIVHTIEYDLVILESLEKTFPYKENEKHIYITSLIELDLIKPEWNWYQNPDFPVAECKAFEALMKEKYHLKKLYGSMAPGTTVTKEYLDGYSKLDLPLIAFDEMRFPAIAQILGIQMRDNGFVRDWFDEESLDFRLFNSDNHEVSLDELFKAYKSGYQRAFHPVYKEISLEKL